MAEITLKGLKIPVSAVRLRSGTMVFDVAGPRFTQGRRIADLAAPNHALLVPHAWRSGILVRSDVAVAGGVARIAQRPGLGVDLNEEIVERYRTNR